MGIAAEESSGYSDWDRDGNNDAPGSYYQVTVLPLSGGTAPSSFRWMSKDQANGNRNQALALKFSQQYVYVIAAWANQFNPSGFGLMVSGAGSGAVIQYTK